MKKKIETWAGSSFGMGISGLSLLTAGFLGLLFINHIAENVPQADEYTLLVAIFLSVTSMFAGIMLTLGAGVAKEDQVDIQEHKE